MDVASLLPLTDDQDRLVTAALLIHSEHPDAWFVMRPQFEPVAQQLFVRGYLHRVQRDGRHAYQITKRAVAAWN
jgi:hypothetical protein